jgi:hypothetical protein
MPGTCRPRIRGPGELQHFKGAALEVIGDGAHAAADSGRLARGADGVHEGRAAPVEDDVGKDRDLRRDPEQFFDRRDVEREVEKGGVEKQEVGDERQGEAPIAEGQTGERGGDVAPP